MKKRKFHNKRVKKHLFSPPSPNLQHVKGSFTREMNSGKHDEIKKGSDQYFNEKIDNETNKSN